MIGTSYCEGYYYFFAIVVLSDGAFDAGSLIQVAAVVIFQNQRTMFKSELFVIVIPHSCRIFHPRTSTL